MSAPRSHLREIVIQHRVESQKVQAAAQQVGRDQHPRLARPEAVDCRGSGLIRQVRVDHIHVYPFL